VSRTGLEALSLCSSALSCDNARCNVSPCYIIYIYHLRRRCAHTPTSHTSQAQRDPNPRYLHYPSQTKFKFRVIEKDSHPEGFIRSSGLVLRHVFFFLCSLAESVLLLVPMEIITRTRIAAESGTKSPEQDKYISNRI